MSEVTLPPAPPRPPVSFTANQLDLIKRTVAKDTNGEEFDLFMAAALSAGLDPIRRQITAVVFNKNDNTKRKMSIIYTIDGLRAIADRMGDYRPSETSPKIEYDEALKDPVTNPLGIVRAEVIVWRRDAVSGTWFPVAGEAYWDEYCAIEDVWAEDETGRRRPTGKKKLAPNWQRMARVMIAKCAEAQALRRGWPAHFSGLYGEEEMDRAIVIDGAFEVVEKYRAEERSARVGGPGALVSWNVGEPNELVPWGRFADRVMDHIAKLGTPDELDFFTRTNAAALQQFWAESKSDALALKAKIELRMATLLEANPA